MSPAVFKTRTSSRAVLTVLASTVMTATEFRHTRQPGPCVDNDDVDSEDDVNLWRISVH